MSIELTKLLEDVDVTAPQQVDGLLVFGIRWANRGRLQYTTLDEALLGGTLKVTEVSEGGQVPVLKVVNNGDEMVFLMAGEQLIGAKQNRILNASIMAPARTELNLPVSCVEQGRWHYRSPTFLTQGTMSHGILRKIVSGQAAVAYRLGRGAMSDQAGVWREVTRKLGAFATASPSAELEQVYEDSRGRLGEVLDQLRVPDTCAGVAFVLGGRVAGVDVFDKPATLSKLFPKLARAYAIDALEPHPPEAKSMTSDQIRSWLRSASAATIEPFKSAGLGHDVRLTGRDVVGAGLVVDDEPVHVELFAR